MTFQFSPAETEISAQRIAGISDKQLSQETSRFYKTVTKRILDVILTLLAAPVVVPLVLLLALLITMDGHKPFYSQMRVGKNGRHFRMWKLRTMVPNADALLANYLASNPAAKLEWKTTQKLKNDPRITWVGGILRKASADELPQLWNVLNGTMSLVGPRPMMVCQESEYTGASYFEMTPGLTGLWQVSDRNNCEFIGRVAYDETYYRCLCFKTDARIILKTVSVILRGTGY